MPAWIIQDLITKWMMKCLMTYLDTKTDEWLLWFWSDGHKQNKEQGYKIHGSLITAQPKVNTGSS